MLVSGGLWECHLVDSIGIQTSLALLFCDVQCLQIVEATIRRGDGLSNARLFVASLNSQAIWFMSGHFLLFDVMFGM